MATPYGKAVRKLRIDAGVRLKDMADALEVKSAYLSAVESGRKRITDKLVNQTVMFFEQVGVKGKSDIRAHLSGFVDQSQPEYKIDLNGKNDSDRELVVAFARRFSDLSPDKKREIGMIVGIETEDLERQMD